MHDAEAEALLATPPVSSMKEQQQARYSTVAALEGAVGTPADEASVQLWHLGWLQLWLQANEVLR